MKRRLPLALLTVAALVVLPATTASATGGHHGYKPGHSASYGKPKPKPTKPAPANRCDVARDHKGNVVSWDAYSCDKATGYFLYKKVDTRKAAGFWNSGPQHRVALHPVWAWPTADAKARTERSPQLPRHAEVIPLALDATDTAAVCADPRAYGLQVDLVGDGTGHGLDVMSLIPLTITPPNGGFQPNTLAYYAHYEVRSLLDIDALCRPAVVVPTPEPTTPAPAPEPTPEPTPEVSEAPEPVVVPEPEPTETSEVLPAPVETPEPTPSATTSPAPAPLPTERAEVLSAVEDDDTLAATGTQAVLGLLAAVAAIAGGAALVLARRRATPES